MPFWAGPRLWLLRVLPHRRALPGVCGVLGSVLPLPRAAGGVMTTSTLRRPRPVTPWVLFGDQRRVTVRRACDCGRVLGDATRAEVIAAVRTLPAGVFATGRGMVAKGKPAPRPLCRGKDPELPDATTECPECTPNPPGLEWTLTLPYLRPPLNLNVEKNRYERAEIVRQIHSDVGTSVRAQRIPPLAALAAELHYVPAKPNRRDADNLVATSKRTNDAIVRANLVPDDAQRWITQTMPVIHDPDPVGARLYLVICEIQTAGGAA